MPAKICVIGARGYYGKAVVRALAALDGVRVEGAGRSAERRVDLLDPTTFAALDGFDAIVNCSDTVGAPPDALARHCLRHGQVLFEMGADASEIRRLLAVDEAGATGTVVAGVGLFPGYSTVLAATTAEGECRSLELGIRLSPFSGAGAGNCRLMARFLDTPSIRYQGGARIEGPPLGRAARFPFLSIGERTGPLVAMPDTELLRRSTAVEAVATHLALVPSFLRHNFAVATKLHRVLGPLRPVLRKLTEWSMLLMRAALLRGVSTGIQLTALCDRGSASERVRMASFADGQHATAVGVSAAVALWLEGARAPHPGTFTTADLFELESLTERMRTLGCELELE